MALILPKYRFLKHLLLALPLLWALLLLGTATHAQSAAQNQTGFVHTETVSSDEGLTGLQQAMLYLAQEGTTATPPYSFAQPAFTVPKTVANCFASQLVLPPYAARAPGDNFFCQFFYTSTQPQAP